MQLSAFWAIAVCILACCRFTHLNAFDLSTLSWFTTPKTVSCYKCTTLTKSACKDIAHDEKAENLIEECGPTAKGCVKQVIEKIDGSVVTFRECYYAKISTFLFTNLVCENIPRTASYENARCYKCNGKLCNSGSRLDAAFSSWLTLAVFTSVAFIFRI